MWSKKKQVVADDEKEYKIDVFDKALSKISLQILKCEKNISTKNIRKINLLLLSYQRKKIILLGDIKSRGGVQNPIIPPKERKYTLLYYPEVTKIHNVNLEDFSRRLLNPITAGKIKKSTILSQAWAWI